MASSKAISISVLVLRMITFFSLMACVVLIVTDNYKLSGGQKQYFYYIFAYRYVLAIALLGLGYTLLQIPLSIYHVYTEKWLIRGGILATIDFYADKVISFLLATGVGVGFAVGIESKRIIHDMYLYFIQLGATNLDEWRTKLMNFFNRGNIATAPLFIGFIAMALISVLSSINRSQY